MFTVFPTSCVTYGSGNHLHEAAYDAYLSGYVFLVTANVLGKYMVYALSLHVHICLVVLGKHLGISRH